jgi:ABC-2 type transport system permease protein
MTARWPVVSLGTAARRAARDRGALLVAVAFYAIVTSVLAALWRVAAGAHGGAVAGYSGVALTWYVMTSEAAVCALNVRLIEQIGDDIASGAVAVELLRPASALGMRVTTEVGRALPRLVAFAVVGITLANLAAGGPPDASLLLLAAPSLVLAVACNVVTQHAFAAAAFWIRDARSTWFLYQKLVFVVGGMLLPLEVLPGWLHTTAGWLPFAAMAYAPARFASGHGDVGLLGIQLGWLVALSAVAVATFAAGERRLQVAGG